MATMELLDEIKSKFNIYKQTSLENPGLRDEFEDMAMLEMDFLCQIILSDIDTNLWLKFNDGKLDYGEGGVDNPTLTFTTSLAIFKGIIYGEIEISSAHEAGDVSFGGAGEALMDFQAITSVINEFLENM
jgi:hypothetical protein